MLSLLLLPLVTAIPMTWDTIRLKNSCKDKLSIATMGFPNGAGPTEIAAGAQEFTRLPGFDGVVYAISNANSQWGMAGATKAALNFKTGKYYVLKDGFNVPIRISPPVAPARRAACDVVECADAECADASTKWLAEGTHTCDIFGDWTVEFCPSIKEPEPANGVELHFNGDKKLCLDVQENKQADGTPVQVYECNGTGAQKWELTRGQTAVRLAGTNFCLDAGNRAAGAGMKIWTCYDKLAAQTMWYTDDNRLAVKDTGLCLTLPKGGVPQTQPCTDANPNQVWN